MFNALGNAFGYLLGHSGQQQNVQLLQQLGQPTWQWQWTGVDWPAPPKPLFHCAKAMLRYEAAVLGVEFKL